MNKVYAGGCGSDSCLQALLLLAGLGSAIFDKTGVGYEVPRFFGYHGGLCDNVIGEGLRPHSFKFFEDGGDDIVFGHAELCVFDPDTLKGIDNS
jgi:hypothetical protein